MTPSDLNWESFEDDSDAVVGAPPKKNKTAARKTEKAATSGGKASGKSASKSTGQARAEPEFEAPEPDPEPPAPPEPGLSQEEAEKLIARARGEGRAAGFEEGVAHAEARGQTALRMILSDISEQLADAMHEQVARDAAIEAAVRKMAEALLSGIAPAYARSGLAVEVAEAVIAARRAQRADPGAPPLRVRLSPAQVEPVRAALTEAGLQAEIDGDPELGELSARLEWADGEDRIDLSEALDAARAALDRHLPDAERRYANG